MKTNGNALHILLVEDDKDDFVLLQDLLETIEPTPDVQWAASYAEALDTIDDNGFDIALVDYRLGSHTGIEFIQSARETGFEEPVVFVTGQENRETDVAAMEAGASEYLAKRNLDAVRLERALRYAMEQHRLRKALEAASRREIELKNRLLSHVSHELRTPLSAIQDYTSLLLDELVGELSEEQRDFLEVIESNVTQLVGMVQDLLDSARLEKHQLAFRLTSVDLAEVIEDAIDTLASRAEADGVELSAPDVDSALPRVYADRRRTRQVLVNLVSNALRHTPSGGTVRIHATAIDPDRVRVTVEDEGEGVNENLAERVFERLERGPSQDSRTGLGLGLYLCRRYVERQDGEIWLENDSDGAIFRFTLPAFSIARLVDPLLEEADVDVRHGHVTLARVTLARSETSSPLDIEDPRIARVRRVVRACILPDLDLLLPTVVHDAGRATIPVLVLADQAGVDALLQRLNKQLPKVMDDPDEQMHLTTRVERLDLSDQEPNPGRAIESAVIDRLEAA